MKVRTEEESSASGGGDSRSGRVHGRDANDRQGWFRNSRKGSGLLPATQRCQVNKSEDVRDLRASHDINVSALRVSTPVPTTTAGNTAARSPPARARANGISRVFGLCLGPWHGGGACRRLKHIYCLKSEEFLPILEPGARFASSCPLKQLCSHFQP